MQRTKCLGLHMKVGNDVNITAVNAEKNVELGKGDKNSVLDLTEDFYITAVEPLKMFRDYVVLTKRSILALLQFTKQILHTNAYFSLKRIFLSKAGTSLQSVGTFSKQVQLGQRVYVHNCGGLQKTFRPSRRASRYLQLRGWPRCFSSPLNAAGFSLALPRFTLPCACSSSFRRKGLWQNYGHVCLVLGRGVTITSCGRGGTAWAERTLAERARWWI